MQAFDWDRDCAQLMRTRPLVEVPDAPPRRQAARPLPWRNFAVLLAGALLIGAVVNASADLRRTEGDPALEITHLQGLRPFESFQPQIVLQAYGERQVAAFRRGIARFSDGALLDQQAALDRDLRAGGAFEPELSDMLALLQEEIGRRSAPRFAR